MEHEANCTAVIGLKLRRSVHRSHRCSAKEYFDQIIHKNNNHVYQKNICPGAVRICAGSL